MSPNNTVRLQCIGCLAIKEFFYGMTLGELEDWMLRHHEETGHLCVLRVAKP